MNDKKDPTIKYPKKRAKRLKAGDKDYVNNKEFYNAIVEYQKTIKRSPHLEGVSSETLDYICRCMMSICVRRANSFNFVDYSYKDEMIGDGLIDCVKSITKFNPEKSQNPFSYFTTAANNAFIRRIKQEKTELYAKYSAIDNCMLFTEEGNDLQIYGTPEEEESKNKFMRNFEESKRKEKAKIKKSNQEKNKKKKKLLKF